MQTGMNRERTRDIYEAVPGCPPPPLVPLPAPGDLSSLGAMGISTDPAAERIVRATMALTGLNGFVRELPATIAERLRTVDKRGSYLFSPVVSATLALADDPRGLGPIARAATLLAGARGLYSDMQCGSFPADTFRGQPLEMGQYPNLFSTGLIVENRRARIFKSTNTGTVTVAVGGRLFMLDVGDPAAGTPVKPVEQALEDIIADALDPENAAAPQAGLLTAAGHMTQLQVFTRHAQDPVNAESLDALRHSFVTLCFDLDRAPQTDAEAALWAQTGNMGNRWFHHSLQLVVFGNGKACAICNFSTYLDGNTMMRGAAEIQRRAAACPLESTGPSLPAARELQWHIRPEALARAQADLKPILDHQVATFEIPGFGRRFFAENQIDAVPAFVAALEMTAKKLIGGPARITQFLTMSRYRYMDLVDGHVATSEVLRFVEYMEGPSVGPVQARALLQAAIASQAEACREARRTLNLDAILGLFVVSRSPLQRLYVMTLLGLQARVLRMLGKRRPMQREIIISHPEIFPEVPIVGRPGIRLPYVKYFGLHYQIMDDRIVITMMPGVQWDVPNEKLVAELAASLARIKAIL